MKLYQTKVGTNPRRVILYLREKGIDVPRVEIDQQGRDLKSDTFLAMNPAGRIPVLLLDDGRALAESAAIVEYLEELNPSPPMIGTDAFERARVRMLERIASDLIQRAQLWLLHSIPYFAERTQQDPLVAAAAKPFVDQQLSVLEAEIGDHPFLAGEMVTIADCTLFALFQSCRVRFDIPFGAEYPRLDAWYARFAQRPSVPF